MDIQPEDVENKKVVGSLGDSKLIEIETTGGLHVLVVAKSKPEIIAMAPHPAFMRHLARKTHPECIFTGLAKSDDVNPQHFAHLVAYYEELTERSRAIGF